MERVAHERCVTEVQDAIRGSGSDHLPPGSASRERQARLGCRVQSGLTLAVRLRVASSTHACRDVISPH
jgi:hypothetical protein